MLLELAATVMPENSSPIVQTLQRQMYVFVGLQFQDSELRIAVQVSTSIIARSEAENAGTCE